MMNIFFSATTLWFYDAADKEKYEAGIGWPADATPIDNTTWGKYTSVPPEGFQLGSSTDGQPTWIPVPPPTQEKLIAQAEQEKQALRSVADSEISWRQDAVDAGMATDGETSSLTEWKKYRVLLMRVDTSTAPDIEWPTPPAVPAS